MTRQVIHGAQDDPDGAEEVEAAATSTAIAGLRRRLKRHGIEHPSVRRELGKLEDLLIALFEQPGRPGRHRSQASRSPSRQASQETGEAAASDLKPDPAEANTEAEFVAVLRRYRAWSGDPAWRRMAARSRQRTSHSAIYKAMHRQDLPKLDVVEAIIIGCGGQEDLPAFTAAWHRLSAGGQVGEPKTSELLPAPVPTLQLASGG